MVRFFDIFFSSIAILFFSLLLVPITLILKVTGEGEVLFLQERVGQGGKIFKLIDFGRSIVTFNKTVYCSDSFKKDGDANSQYNFGPFYEPSKKRIEPNYSFDLCRLGCSIYDFIIDDEATISEFDDFS